jgi:hypothetical protein
VAPYLWAIAMNGDAMVMGQKADVDVSFSDIWDELNFAFMMEYEARKGHWGLWGNTIYAILGNSNGNVGGIEIEPKVNALWRGQAASTGWAPGILRRLRIKIRRL